MSSHVLIWAAVPHNGDGVVFQVRIAQGLQRFYVSRRVLEDVFDLEPRASDARELQLFYLFLDRILTRATVKRSIAGSDTLQLQVTDFSPLRREKSRPDRYAAAQAAA
jgi:hypothetical protein